MARRYFLEDRTKVQIAAELHLSRFKVARLIDLARSTGIVRITIATPGAIDTELSMLLRERFGLRRALVVNTVDDDDAMARGHIAEVTARLLTEVLTPADVLGLSWSRAVLATAERLARIPACAVVQLTGGLSSPDVTAGLIDAVDRLARSGGGRGYSFYAPMFVSDPASVEVVRRQPETAAAFFAAPVLAKDVKVSLTGAEETPPVTTSATGQGTISIAKDHTVKGSIKTTGIDGVAAHIHVGAPGQSGPPIITLTKGADGAWKVPDGSKLTDEQFANFTSGNLYVNVHSPDHKSGEIRAQLKP